MPVHIKTITKGFFFFACFLTEVGVVSVLCTTVSTTAAFANDLDAFAKKAPSETVSIVVADRTSGSVDYSYNPDQLTAPASVLKLVTSSASLDLLGVDFSFSTKLFFKPASDKHTIATLVVLGGGDPTLSTEKVYAISTSLKKRGIQTIDELRVDDSKFVESRTPAGIRAYQAAASPMAINYNSEEIVECTPGRLDAAHCTTRFESLSDSRTGFIETWKNELRHAGIDVKKVNSSSKEPAGHGLELLFDYRSDPLPKILFDMNHFSTNIIGDSLVYQLGCDSLQEPFSSCSFAKGLKKIQRWLVEHGVNDAELFDGCGLSPKNRISAGDLHKILVSVLASPAISPELTASLSIANKTGTLKSRDFSSDVLFRGKTGSLDGVITLAGIVRSARGKDKIVVLLLHGVTDVQKAKSWEESFVDAVYRQF